MAHRSKRPYFRLVVENRCLLDSRPMTLSCKSLNLVLTMPKRKVRPCLTEWTQVSDRLALVRNLYFTGYAYAAIGDSMESIGCELHGTAPSAPAALVLSPADLKHFERLMDCVSVGITETPVLATSGVLIPGSNLFPDTKTPLIKRAEKRTRSPGSPLGEKEIPVTVKKRPMTADGTDAERRKTRRFPVVVPVEVSWRGPDGIAVGRCSSASQCQWWLSEDVQLSRVG